jgi:hypothetical protein
VNLSETETSSNADTGGSHRAIFWLTVTPEEREIAKELGNGPLPASLSDEDRAFALDLRARIESEDREAAAARARLASVLKTWKSPAQTTLEKYNRTMDVLSGRLWLRHRASQRRRGVSRIPRARRTARRGPSIRGAADPPPPASDPPRHSPSALAVQP